MTDVGHARFHAVAPIAVVAFRVERTLDLFAQTRHAGAEVALIISALVDLTSVQLELFTRLVWQTTSAGHGAIDAGVGAKHLAPLPDSAEQVAMKFGSIFASAWLGEATGPRWSITGRVRTGRSRALGLVSCRHADAGQLIDTSLNTGVAARLTGLTVVAETIGAAPFTRQVFTFQ